MKIIKVIIAGILYDFQLHSLISYLNFLVAIFRCQHYDSVWKNIIQNKMHKKTYRTYSTRERLKLLVPLPQNATDYNVYFHSS